MKTIYYGGSILTMEDKMDNPEAVLVEKGIITKVGSFSEIEKICAREKKLLFRYILG